MFWLRWGCWSVVSEWQVREETEEGMETGEGEATLVLMATATAIVIAMARQAGS